jgi:hypothetical protein
MKSKFHNTYKKYDYNITLKILRIAQVISSLSIIIVSFKLLASARVVCNIVYVQVRGQIHKKLRRENKFLSKLIIF